MLDLSMAFSRVENVGLLQKLKSCGISSSGVWPYFTFSQEQGALSGSGWVVFVKLSS